MLLYATIGTNNTSRAKTFYDSVLGPLGYVCRQADETGVGYAAKEDTRCRLWIVKPHDQKAAAVGNGCMVALEATSRMAVDAFYIAAIAAGGTEEGKPGLRPFHANFYAAFVRDLDGNKISAVCELPPPK